ncbi:MAG: heat-inducible transcriptional repressor HrcA [Anaerolineales bacterium]
MNELTERQRKILLLVVRDYIESAQPVGSLRLLEHYQIDTSSATVRNEMAALTELGYLRQPHTSAGRVPTEEGYRYFVSAMLRQAELPEPVQHTISHQFHQARPEIEEWMTLAASVLARQSQAVSLITAPRAAQVRFKHLELIATQGRQVLMVLVLTGGEVNQQILSLAEPVPQERLSLAATRLTQWYAGRSLEEIAAFTPPADALEADISLLVTQSMRRAAEQAGGHLYYDGLTHVLSEPEFADTDEARRALHLLEERNLLQELLARSAAEGGVGGVQVLIGGESAWEELRQCSIVLAHYGIPGQVTGTLGVLGPMRMSYNRTIPAVRFVAGLLSELVGDAFAGQ